MAEVLFGIVVVIDMFPFSLSTNKIRIHFNSDFHVKNKKKDSDILIAPIKFLKL